jgi:uncharacterized protein YjbJ (UPF0337 family)
VRPAPARPIREEDDMNRDKVEGTVKDVAGKVQRKVGEATGDAGQQAAGAARQLEGKARKAVGTLRDAADDALERDREAVRPRPAGDSVAR